MATVKYYPAMPSDVVSIPSKGILLGHDDTSAEVMTGFGTDTVIYTGQGLTYEDDTLVGGTVTEIVYKAFEANRYRISDIDLPLTNDLPGVHGSDVDLFGGNDEFIGSRVRDYLFAEAGKDSIRGGRGDDTIRGGEDNDLLKGGAGRDEFIFAFGDGKDKIIDFDTHGPIQDVIVMTNPDALKHVEIYERFNNVVIEYGEGDKIILLDTDLKDLSHKNFDSMPGRHFDFG